MTAVISNNVIKISTNGAPAASLVKSTKPEYPRTCDFCRDTYNSELTYNRHKDTGKCFRFCRLREEERLRQSKRPKVSIYPRVCDSCLKVYQNKHSFYKHKSRCITQVLINDDSDDNEFAIDATIPLSNVNVDIVDLANDDIENIPITDNKENIDDFSSNFILTLDVDKNYSDSISLYPRICEICHKVFKTEELFESHKTNTKCFRTGMKMVPLMNKLRPTKQTALHFRRCKNCGKVIHHKQLYNNHIKRCGQALIPTVSVLKKTFDLIPAQNTQPEEPQPSTDSPVIIEASPKQSPYSRYCPGCKVFFTSKSGYYRHQCSCKRAPGVEKKSIYPRTCEYCGFVFQTKFQFHRHKQKCIGYQDAILDEEDDSYVSCDVCNRSFDTFFLYRQHMKYVHPEMKSETMPVVRKYMYPRKCSKCFNVYLSRQTFCNHKKRCITSIDTDMIGSFDEIEFWPEESAEKVTYPRTCEKCHRTYSNRQSFCNHRRLCPDFASSGRESLLYPRRCEHCTKIYSSKQTYHHHKVRCAGFSKYLNRKPIYPRTCSKCNCTYAYKQAYQNHLMKCSDESNFIVEDEYSDGNLDESNLHCEPSTKQNYSKRGKTYPRMCEFCRKIYANRYTFCKHKSRCVPVEPSVDIVEDPCTSVQLSKPITYPRECENCFGTFKNKTTFNAHKIRCDFFETKVNETEFKTYFKSNCEHCRNIVNTHRRIFHQHLQQCTNPIIVPTDPLSFVEHDPESIEPVPNTSEGANFCECCGVFFKSRAEIEKHKRDLQSSEDSSFECHICMEIFDSEEELTDHKSRCILNSSNRTYPRFCECCRKVYKTKQTFYNHKKNCHVHCLKYFVLKDCENCKLPFKCEKMYFEHIQTCVRFDDGAIAAECEVSAKPADE